MCRGDGGESSPIRAFSAQVQPVIVIENACEATDASLTTKSVNADAPECKPGQARHAASLGKESTGAVRSYDGRRTECERRLYLNGARRPRLFQHHRCVRGPWWEAQAPRRNPLTRADGGTQPRSLHASVAWASDAPRQRMMRRRRGRQLLRPH